MFRQHGLSALTDNSVPLASVEYVSTIPRSQPILEPSNTNTLVERADTAPSRGPPSLDHLWDTAFAGFYATISCLKHPSAGYDKTLEKTYLPYFKDLSTDQVHILFLATCFFEVSTKPPYEELLQNFSLFVKDSMDELQFPFSLEPFKTMCRRGSAMKLPVPGDPKELRLQWQKIIVSQVYNPSRLQS